MNVKDFIQIYSRNMYIEYSLLNQVKIGLGCIIDETGNIEMAYPSHEAKIIEMIGKRKDDILSVYLKMKKRENCSFLLSICLQAHVIAVFENGYIGTLTKKQKLVLERLKLHNIYYGNLGEVNTINQWKPPKRRQEINIIN